MCRLALGVFVVALLSGCSGLPVREMDLPAPCQEPVCDLRADFLQLDAPSIENPHPYRFDSLEWRAPAGAVVRQQDATTLWRWPGGQALKVKRVQAQDFQFPGLANQFALSRYRVADYPWLLFMQVRSDSEPLRLSDRYIWRMALDNKGSYFLGQKGLYWGELANLDFYYARVELMALRQLAFLVDPTMPDQIYQLMGYGSEPEWFEGVLGSMRVRPALVAPSSP